VTDIARGTDRAPASTGGGIERDLCQTEQREPWLRLEARATRLAIAGFGHRKLPAQSANGSPRFLQNPTQFAQSCPASATRVG